MATNLYHLLGFLPATQAWEMPPALERLAQILVASGKLRVNADNERNFVRYGSSNSDLTFTSRELRDPALAATTKARIGRLVAPAAGVQGLSDLWTYLNVELKKVRGINAEKEIRIARVIIQSAHPVVIQLLIASGTEIFVSYAHNVADLMPVHVWEKDGGANGMQATDGHSTAVYISAGGDPFFEGEHKTYTTDGFPALARMVVIAGQELGHFADLRHGADGIIGRHSIDASHSRLRAAPVARRCWLSDRQNIARLAASYHACGLPLLRRVETSVDFYHRRMRYSPQWLLCQLRRFMVWVWFITRCRRSNLLNSFHVLPGLRLGDAIEHHLADMAFNLAPDADAYRHPDPLVEEAIIILEAVARVPQQVHKWRHEAVAAAWPQLYRFYFESIIPACAAALPDAMPPQVISPLRRVIIYLRRLLQPEPGYYPRQ